MRKTIILTENQLHQILNSVNENTETKEDVALEKAIRLYNTRPDLLWTYLTDYGVNYLVRKQKLSIDDAKDVVQEKLIKMAQDPDFATIVAKGKDDLLPYYTQRLNTGGIDVHRQHQKFNNTTTSFDDTFGVDDDGEMDNDIDSETSFSINDTNSNSEEDKYMLFLLDPEHSPLKKQPNSLGFVLIYYFIIKNETDHKNKQTVLNKMKQYILEQPEMMNVILRWGEDILTSNIETGVKNIFQFAVKYEDLDEATKMKRLQYNLMGLNSKIFGTGKRGEKRKENTEKSSEHNQAKGLENKKLFQIYNQYADIAGGLKNSEYTSQKNDITQSKVDISGRSIINNLMKSIQISAKNEYNNNPGLQSEITLEDFINQKKADVVKALEQEYNVNRHGIMLDTKQPMDKKKLKVIKDELETRFAPYKNNYDIINEVVSNVMKKYLR